MFTKIQLMGIIEFGAPFLDTPYYPIEKEKCECCGSSKNDLTDYFGRFGKERICNECLEVTEQYEQDEQISILQWLAGSLN